MSHKKKRGNDKERWKWKEREKCSYKTGSAKNNMHYAADMDKLKARIDKINPAMPLRGNACVVDEGHGCWLSGGAPTDLRKRERQNECKNNRMGKHCQVKPWNWDETVFNSFQFYPFHSLYFYEWTQICTHLRPY